MTIKVDALIIGGGATGLMLLNYLTRSRMSAILVENTALGTGQTVASQGILHTGWKYLLDGAIADGVEELRNEGEITRREMQYEGVPYRRGFLMWGYDEAARHRMERACRRMRAEWEYPEEPPGSYFGRLPCILNTGETVIDPVDLIRAIAAKHKRRIWHGHAVVGNRARVVNSDTGHDIEIDARQRIWCCGEGLKQAGIEVQLRPLCMGLMRGDLPRVNGHFIGGGTGPSLTITSHKHSNGQTVWQLGGALANTAMRKRNGHGDELYLFASAVRLALPRLETAGVEWSSYLVNRVELPRSEWAADVQVVRTGPQDIVAVPTKLALLSKLCRVVQKEIAGLSCGASDIPSWPSPPVASPPWETAQWQSL